MTATETASSGITDASNASPPPDWALVPFDVGCARCGHDLHGLTEPKCPGCSFEFDWAQAVPIEELACAECGYHLYGLSETRCPECGLGFDWNEALDAWHRRHKDIIEYRWREGPVRATLRTWRRLLRPGAFWRTLDLHDPPNTKPLILFVVVTLVASALVWNTVITIEEWEWQRRFTVRNPFGSTRLSDLPGMWLGSLTRKYFWSISTLNALWCCLTLPALLILRQSMRRCRVRNAHVIRVWTYATAGLLLPYLTACGAILIAVILAGGRHHFWIPGMGLGYVLFAVWGIRQGYRHYLRMNHSLGVAIATQAIAVLAAGLLAGTVLALIGVIFGW